MWHTHHFSFLSLSFYNTQWGVDLEDCKFLLKITRLFYEKMQKLMQGSALRLNPCVSEYWWLHWKTIFKSQQFLDAWAPGTPLWPFVRGFCARCMQKWAFLLSWNKGLNLIRKQHLKHWMPEYLEQVWRNWSKRTLVNGRV